MAVFAAYLDGKTDEAAARIKERYSGAHLELLDERLYLISADTIAETVARRIGLKGDNQVNGVTGVVFKLNAAYAGFTYRSIWDWLKEAEGKAG